MNFLFLFIKTSLEYEFLGNTLQNYFISLLILLLGILVTTIFGRLALAALKKTNEKSKSPYIDFLIEACPSAFFPLVYLGVIYLSINNLLLHDLLKKILYVLAIIYATFLVIRFLLKLIEFFLNNSSQTNAQKIFSQGSITLIKVLVWGFGIIFVLDNLGFKIGTVVAGLGIGGIAVALAAQNILGDLFNYFVILFDRPFEIGDFVVMENHMGTVEYIGIKTTRLRSLSGEQIILANTDITRSRLQNYKRMEQRRVAFQIRVVYGTTLEQLKEIPSIISNIISNIPEVLLDRAHFIAYGDFSLIFEIVYYVLNNDYNKYMDVQQKINLRIKEEFEKHKIEFAYPTHLLYVK